MEAAVSAAAPVATATLGKPAPDFTATDLSGKAVSLKDYRGKTVVLEWFNPGCPFVQKSHTVGSLVDTAARHSKNGVVWLAINSGAPGKQGHGKETNLEAQKTFKMEHPILMDEAGIIGRAYGAERTPHLYVIDPNGALVYRGAIDNSPDGEKQSPAGGTLVNYVDAALADLGAGRPVAVADTKSYGCSVKY
jgi:peroxiredoxin